MLKNKETQLWDIWTSYIRILSISGFFMKSEHEHMSSLVFNVSLAYFLKEVPPPLQKKRCPCQKRQAKIPSPAKIPQHLAKTDCSPHITMPHPQQSLFCSTKWACQCFTAHTCSMHQTCKSSSEAWLQPLVLMVLGSAVQAKHLSSQQRSDRLQTPI